jgi:hypothetical protein
MSSIVPAFSTIRFTLTAAQAIAMYSQGAYKLTQVNAFVNAPPSNAQLLDIPAGSLAQAVVEVDAYGGLPVFVEQGTAPVVKQGQMQNGTNVVPVAINASATMTAAQLLSTRITSTSAAATDIPLPTGTLLFRATSWLPGEYLDWSVTNTGPSLLQIQAGTDHTIVGGAGAAIAVPTLTSVYLRTTLISATAAGVGTFETQTQARAIS